MTNETPSELDKLREFLTHKTDRGLALWAYNHGRLIEANPDISHVTSTQVADLVEQAIERSLAEARIVERSIYIKDHTAGRNSVFIARVKNAIEHKHTFNPDSAQCGCGISKMFLVEAAEDIATLTNTESKDE